MTGSPNPFCPVIGVQYKPASYNFAHVSKDGYPYPVGRKTYDSSIQFLVQALNKAKVGDKEKLNVFSRLRA
ncbi:unnamed protein product [marine sediment metagenome]|uniref:Uncharacterized protein n=1 Tax=marine sediment metagenome TaxID=412755 RepID=X1F4Z1_9ZZZZ